MTGGRFRRISGTVGGCIVLWGSVASLSPHASSVAQRSGRDVVSRELQALEAARARWRAHPIAYYRLSVQTHNALLITVTESDVRNGVVQVARGSMGMPGVEPAPGPGHWGPSPGETVETLFQKIEGMIRYPRYDTGVTYDPRRGYPTGIVSFPSEPVWDGDVSYTIKLTPSPAVPLRPISPGEAYRTPFHARLVDPGGVYDALAGSTDVKPLIRQVWPDRADEIARRAQGMYWKSVGWSPRAGLTGDIIGRLAIPSGAAVCVMEFWHHGERLYALVEKQSVELVR